ncbi:MAG: two-component regulator propeller domain-containing protein [Chitinophagales bacterium]
MRNKLLLFILFIFSCYTGSSQEKGIALTHLTSQDGLSDNRITCMLRDKQGFMWFGTKDGLNRYDGRDFYVFRNRVNDSTSLCSNSITCLAYDDDSVLWIGTSTSGFCSYDFSTQKFRTYNNSNLTLYSNSINVIRFDSGRNALWLGLNNGGLQLFSLETKSLLPLETNGLLDFVNPPGLRSTYEVILKDSTVFIAVLTQSLKKLGDPPVPKPRDLPIAGALTINAAVVASDGHIWCGAWDNGLHQFDDEAKLVASYIFDGTEKLNFSSDEIISIAEDANKILWCGTKASGLHFFDLKKKTFLTDQHAPEIFTSRIYCIYRDDVNRMWVGTEQGLYVYDPLQNQFEVTLLPVPGEKISCRVFDRVIAKGGTEYIASACGLFYRNKTEKQYHYKSFEYRKEKLQLTSIHLSIDGNIFIGTNKTIFILDTTSVELKMIPSNPKIDDKGFYSIYSSRINYITDFWVGTRNLMCGLTYGHTVVMADLERRNLFRLLQGRGDTVIIENLFRKLYVDSKNRLWICGASQGITQFILPPEFDPDLIPFADLITHDLLLYEREWKNRKGKEVIQVNDVYDIVENKDGSFWLTSEVSGLIRFYPENDTAPFSFIKGEYKSLQGLAKQDDNHLWIMTSKGLLSYEVTKGTYKLFDSKQGIPEGISGHFFNDSDSNLSAGFEGGFLSFNPHQIQRDEEQPRVQLTRLWVMDEAADSLLLHKLVLKYDRNFLRFYLSSNCFSNNDQVTYIYQLTGIDHDWRNNENNPYITYTNLPPGNYELMYKAINSDGAESETRSIPIVITPPFYKTLWFYMVVILTVIAGAYAFYRYRIKQILKIQEVRNKIARDLHDDIGSTLGSISLFSQVASVKLMQERTEETKTILDKIKISSREIVDKTSDAVWAVKATNDTLKNLVFRMESYAASLLGAAGIQFNIEYDQSIGETKLEMTKRKNLFYIYKEALHNTIKYAGCTEVNIIIKKDGNKLALTIADNGKGFNLHPDRSQVTVDGAVLQKEDLYNGNGIKNMQARAEEIGGKFRMESVPGKGTTIKIELKISP